MCILEFYDPLNKLLREFIQQDFQMFDNDNLGAENRCPKQSVKNPKVPGIVIEIWFKVNLQIPLLKCAASKQK